MSLPKPKYWPYYCEENVWWQCESGSNEDKVVFVSNHHKSVALWHQRLASESGAPVVWDYHVILLTPRSSDTDSNTVGEEENRGWDVIDFDTDLGLRTDAHTYLFETFGPSSSSNLPPEVRDKFGPLFRVVPAKNYLRVFCSDRGHMKREDGTWVQDPPPWLPIGVKSEDYQGSNLHRFVDMEQSFEGQRFNFGELLDRFAAK